MLAPNPRQIYFQCAFVKKYSQSERPELQRALVKRVEDTLCALTNVVEVVEPTKPESGLLMRWFDLKRSWCRSMKSQSRVVNGHTLLALLSQPGFDVVPIPWSEDCGEGDCCHGTSFTVHSGVTPPGG